MEARELIELSNQIRKETFETICNAGGGHFGGSLSAIEILTVLYFDVLRVDSKDPKWEDRDRFVLAKGHAGPPLYVILSKKGFFEKERLLELDKNGGRLPKHVDRLKVPGIDFSTGPLGQGLSLVNGMAAAVKLDNKDIYVYALLGDGECQEGQVWEAAMSAAHFKLDNIIAFVDRNRCQVDGYTDDINNIEPLSSKWESFGWYVQIIDGHNVESIQNAIKVAKSIKGKPKVIIANTIKGKGISFMENNYLWHHSSISKEQINQALMELKEGVAE